MWGTFAGTVANVREVLVNMVLSLLWVRQSLRNFARLRQSSHEGARAHAPGTLWNLPQRKKTRKQDSHTIVRGMLGRSSLCVSLPHKEWPLKTHKQFWGDAAFLLTIGSFLLTKELFYLQLTILAFLLTIGAFSLTV